MEKIKCRICNTKKEQTDFYYNKKRDKYHTECKKCHAEYNKRRQVEIKSGLGKPYRVNIKINPKHDLTGKHFGKLTVIKLIDTQNGHRMWECICTCGNSCNVAGTNLLRLRQKSCGCLSLCGINNARWTGHHDISGSYWAGVKAGAKIRNILFDITIEQAWDKFVLQNQKCALTNLPLTFNKKTNETIGTASIDRIDSSKGYTVENIQWVHKDVNTMKSDFDEKYFISLCKLITSKYT